METRVDPPHALRRHGGDVAMRRVALASVEASGSQVDGQLPAPIESASDHNEMVAQHAAELAIRLQKEQEQLDRREAMLNAQEAQIENKLRQARLWLEERQRELDAREAALGLAAANPSEGVSPTMRPEAHEVEARQRELDARQAELYKQAEQVTAQLAELAEREETHALQQSRLSERAAELATRSERLALERQQLTAQERLLIQQQSAMDSRCEMLDERDAEFKLREQQLAFRHQEIEAALARFEKLGVCQQRMEEISEQVQQYTARAHYLDRAEQMLAEEHDSLIARRQHLEDDHRAAEERLRDAWRQLNEEREDHSTSVAKAKKELERREAELDQRDESLQQLRVELEETQREVLEMRLATEETWAQLTGALAPAALSSSIAQTRTKLADLFAHQLRELADRRAELQRLREELAREHSHFEEHRSEMQAWVRRREQEMETQAERLIAREQELDRQQAQYDALEGRWTLERDDYRGQIRRMMAELRAGTVLQAA
jgi:hypothetical protein